MKRQQKEREKRMLLSRGEQQVARVLLACSGGKRT